MIVVTTPTGNIGSKVLQHLLDANQAVRVIARDASRIPAATRDRIEVIEGSHGDPEVVNRAFEGAESVFWLAPPNPRAESLESLYVDFVRPACEAFRSRGVKRVVGVSTLGRGVPNTGYISACLAMDDQIAASGVDFRALAMPGFMDNMLGQVGPLKSQGMFFGTMSPDHKVPACDVRDIAAVAVRTLLDGSWSGTGSIAVLGPEDLSANDMAQIMTEVLEKPVRYQQISLEALRSDLLKRGMTPAMAQGMIDMMAAKEAGLDNREPRTPESTTPTSFRQWCQEVLKPAVLA